ncbi:MAG: tRNA-dihydrouridine synthase, partial [Candidatus Micrarchaeota archaeon]
MIIGLAPMAGFTDYYYRELCRKRGAQLTYTEMVSAEALVRGNAKSKELLKAKRSEVTQLFGCNP